MKDTTYRRLLLSLVIVCLLLTVVHGVLAICAYQNASITQFIAKEWW